MNRRAELLLTGRKPDRPYLVPSSLELLDLDQEAALPYGQLMAELDAAGEPLSWMDGLIAAITLEHGAQLTTRNARDFDRVRGLRLVAP